MWKSLLFNAALFWVVSYLGDKNKVNCAVLAVVFAGLHHFLWKHVKMTENFQYLPDTRTPAPCAPGTEPGDKNGMDCKIQGDRHGI